MITKLLLQNPYSNSNSIPILIRFKLLYWCKVHIVELPINYGLLVLKNFVVMGLDRVFNVNVRRVGG